MSDSFFLFVRLKNPMSWLLCVNQKYISIFFINEFILCFMYKSYIWVRIPEHWSNAARIWERLLISTPFSLRPFSIVRDRGASTALDEWYQRQWFTRFNTFQKEVLERVKSTHFSSRLEFVSLLNIVFLLSNLGECYSLVLILFY